MAGLSLWAGLLAVNVFGWQTSKSTDTDKTSSKTNPRKSDAIAELGATSKSPLALPFKRLWEYLSDRTILVGPTVDGERVYQPLQEGRIICLDRRSGSLLWSSDSGGRVTAPVAVGKSREAEVALITSEIEGDGSSSSGSLRAVDPTTGVALWARDFPRPFRSPIVTAKDRLFAGSTDGALYAISSIDGQVLWKVQTQNVVDAGVLVTDKAVYFGGEDGALRAVSPETGQELWKYQTTGRIGGLPAIDDKHIYFGSADGFVYSLDLLDGKLKWKSRTGAGVEASPVLAGDRLVVGSLDNFIYAFSRSNGDRLWKRRLDNRIIFPVIIEGDAVMVAPLRGDHIPVFLLADGRRVNYYRLNRGCEIVGSPSFVDGTLLVPTDKGLLAAVTVAPTKSEEATSGVKTPATAVRNRKDNPHP
jgi:outer membrane protein assembly factor BamB